MAQWNATALVVDDRDPSIHYSSGWQQVTGASGSGEYLLTKSGASSAGLTASFTFNGTGVEVYGSLGSFDINGQPTTSYTVDGASDATYTAPIIQPGSYTVGNLYYRSPPLPDGLHELVITNLNGTSPNVYWLDYILYTPSTAIQLLANPTGTSPSLNPTILSQSIALEPISTTDSEQSATSVATSQPPTAPIIVMDASSVPLTEPPASSVPIPISSFPSIPTSSIAEAPAAVASFSRGRPPSGVIIGSVIASLAFVTLVVGLFWVWRRRKLRRSRSTRRDAFGSLPVSRDPFRRITRASQYSDSFQYETPSLESGSSAGASCSDALNAPVPSSPAPASSISHVSFTESHKSTNEAGRRGPARSRLYERFSFAESRKTPVAPPRTRNEKLQLHDPGTVPSRYASSSISSGSVFSVESKLGHYIGPQETREK